MTKDNKIFAAHYLKTDVLLNVFRHYKNIVLRITIENLKIFIKCTLEIKTKENKLGQWTEGQGEQIGTTDGGTIQGGQGRKVK